MSLQLDSIIYFVPCIFSLIISDYHYLFQSNTMVPLVRTPCSFWENQRKILQKEKKKESGSNLICRYGRSSHWINRPYSSRVSFCAKRKSWTMSEILCSHSCLDTGLRAWNMSFLRRNHIGPVTLNSCCYVQRLCSEFLDVEQHRWSLQPGGRTLPLLLFYKTLGSSL